VRPQFPNLGCEETDVVRLSPYARGSKTKKQLAVDLTTLDFLVTEANPNRRPLFFIELKTGPGSIVILLFIDVIRADGRSTD
jgi:hypothetical protein